MKFTQEDYLKVNRKASREEEIENTDRVRFRSQPNPCFKKYI